MARWMKAFAMALAAVVGLVPAFAQVPADRAASRPRQVLPAGEELLDTQLTVLGMTMGVTGEAAKATLENRLMTLRDVGLSLAWGGVSGAGAYWMARGLEELGRRGP